MAQYQAYSKQPYHDPSAGPQPHDPHTQFQAPSATTYPPPQHPDQYSNMSQHPQQPNMAYQPQAPMSDKPQAHTMSHEHVHKSAHSFGNKWTFGLFDCCSPFGTCCFSCWCPCFVFGKTYARDKGKGETSGCNAMCCLWTLAASFGFNSCFQCIFRGQQREQFGIEGNGFNDFCASCWCSCCVVLQAEKESVVRVTGMDPKTKVAYQPVNQSMVYPA